MEQWVPPLQESQLRATRVVGNPAMFPHVSGAAEGDLLMRSGATWDPSHQEQPRVPGGEQPESTVRRAATAVDDTHRNAQK